MSPTAQERINEARIKKMADELLDRNRREIEEIEPEFKAAVEIVGERLPPLVVELIDLLLAFEPIRQGPHGAIWELAKANSLAEQIKRPYDVVKQHNRLVQRRDELVGAINEGADEKQTEELIQTWVNESGRPLR